MNGYNIRLSQFIGFVSSTSHTLVLYDRGKKTSKYQQ